MVSCTNSNHNEIIDIFCISIEWLLYAVAKIQSAYSGCIVCCFLKFCVSSAKCCLLSVSVKLLMCFVMIMPRIQLGFGGHAFWKFLSALLKYFFFLVCYSNHTVWLFFCLFLLTFPSLATKFRILNCRRPWILFFTTFCHPVNLTRMAALFSVLFSCFFMFLSIGCPLSICSQIFQCQILTCFIATETYASWVEYSMEYLCI